MQEILNNVLPVFLLLGLGNLLLRLGLASRDFYQASDRLVYYVFFPAMLFWKIGGAEVPLGPALDAALACLATVVVVWLLSLVVIRWRRVPGFSAGAFSQVSYRFNTYIGMAVVLSAFGEPGGVIFGVIISLSIPVINVLAVSTMIWFGGDQQPTNRRVRIFLRELVKNPLILSCVAGLLWSAHGPALPGFVNKTLALVSAITLPMALLSIGGGLDLARARAGLDLALWSCVLKLAAMPLVGWGMLALWGLEGLPVRVAMVFLALPTATSAYILSTQMKSDVRLTASAIVICTLLSFLSLSLVLAIWG